MHSRPFYDEEGRHHHHDSYGTYTTYTCSKGHQFAIREQRGCPSKDCDFKGKCELQILKQ
jgi:hypothetical protein